MSVISMSTSTSTWPISVMSKSTSKIYSSTRVLSTSAPCLVVVFLCTCIIVYKYVDTCVCMYVWLVCTINNCIFTISAQG